MCNISAIGKGFLIYLGVGQGDGEEQVQKLAEKIVNLRIFSNEEDKFDRSLLDEKGEALVISQFTLYANTRKGNRPSFIAAARPEAANPLYEELVRQLRAQLGEARVGAGVFGEAIHFITSVA